MSTHRSFLLSAACAAGFILFCLIVAPAPTPLKFSGAMQALQFWNAQRAYPAKQIDDRLYSAAFDEARYERSSERSLLGSPDEWRQLGPHNIGGRTLAVAVNPKNTKTIFAGSASGGLWRSYTEGKGAAAWHHVKTGFPVLSVSSIAVAPNDSNLMIIGTGEVYNQFSSVGGVSIRTTRGSYGIGILRTTNSGVSWTKTLDWNQGDLHGVQSVKIHPKFTDHVWAATTEGIYKSIDTGKTWLKMSSVPMGTDLVFDLNDSSVVLAAHGNLGSTGGGIYRTLDGGKTWEKLTAGLPPAFGGKIIFAQYLAAPNVIFASIGNGAESGTWLCKTTNYGDTWGIITTFDYASYQGWYSHIVAVDPADSSKVICGGIDLFKSMDGGVTLTQKSLWYAWYFGLTIPGEPEGPANYSHADHHTVVYDPENYDKIYFGNDGGVFCSTDGGETFEGRNGGYQTSQFYNGFSSAWQDSTVAIGGLQDNSTAIYRGTNAWFRAIGGDGCMTAMSPTSLDTMYGSSQSLNVLRSANRGASFSGLSIPGGAVTSFVGPFALSESNPKILYAAREKVFKSINAGSSWSVTNANTALDGNPVLAIAIAPSSSDTVYATTAPVSSRGRIFRTTNGGTVWSDITGTLPDRYMIDIAIDPSNASVVYVTLSGFGSVHLYRTANSGKTWSAIGSGLPDVPTSAVVLDPFRKDHLYIGNDLGVYLSTDGGGSWTGFNDGFTDAAMIMDLSISRKNRSLRAVTHGNGVFERRLFGGTTGVHDPAVTVHSFRLEQNYPNPFNPATTIEYIVGTDNSSSLQKFVSIKIYNVLGEEVAVVVNEQKTSGSYSVRWDASRFSAGTYFIRMTAGHFTSVRKMLLIK